MSGKFTLGDSDEESPSLLLRFCCDVKSTKSLQIRWMANDIRNDPMLQRSSAYHRSVVAASDWTKGCQWYERARDLADHIWGLLPTLPEISSNPLAATCMLNSVSNIVHLFVCLSPLHLWSDWTSLQLTTSWIIMLLGCEPWRPSVSKSHSSEPTTTTCSHSWANIFRLIRLSLNFKFENTYVDSEIDPYDLLIAMYSNVSG